MTLSVAPKLLRIIAVTLIAGGAAACRGPQMDFSALSPRSMPTTEDGLRQEADRLGAIYDRKPGEKQVSMQYSLVLRQLGRHGQAVAVMQRASLSNVGDQEIAAAYGKALADAGLIKEASDVLANAHTPDRPNPRILSTQASLADKLGEHERAQELYVAALKLNPGDAAIMSNLGLSYALSKRLADAERVLIQATRLPGADDRVRANLAMVQGLIAGQNSGRGNTNTWADIRKAEGARKKAM